MNGIPPNALDEHLRRHIGTEHIMDITIAAIDFAAFLATFRADAEAKIAEVEVEAAEAKKRAEANIADAKKLMETVSVRALESLDITGRLNALGAERVVQIGAPHRYWGVQMFVIDEQSHGTLLIFGAGNRPGFQQTCWCCLTQDRRLIAEPIKVGIELGLRSWNLGGGADRPARVMKGIREAIEAGESLASGDAWVVNTEVESVQELAPALDIEIRQSPSLKLASLTPKEWWIDDKIALLRSKE